MNVKVNVKICKNGFYLKKSNYICDVIKKIIALNY